MYRTTREFGFPLEPLEDLNIEQTHVKSAFVTMVR